MIKVLLIDDEERLRETVAELLRLHDFEVITAENGLDGYNKCLQFEPSVILCDLMMPVLNGFEFIKKIKITNLSHIPIIVFTAMAEVDINQLDVKLKANYFLKKPVLTKTLIEHINKCIAN